ncbi:MAG: hypothetical protein N3D72_03630, partial [Candidatus Methanomethyliaceae archaeon]|nr:hypothetical protein [Candidatus Methanomethyliaceae archaeon]
MNSKGISPIIASILLIMIVISSASVVYNIAGSLTILPPADTSVYLEDLKIVNVGAEGNYIYIYAINRGGVDVIVDAVYVESPSGGVLAYHPVYYNVSAGGTVKITIPKGNLDISNPLKFKLASKKGTLTTSLEIVKGVATPYLPSLFTFYPTTANIIKGSHIEGTLPNSVMYIDNSYYTIRSEAHTNNPAYHPTGYIVNQGSYVNGSVLLLQSEDQQSMYFLSSPSGYVERIYNASQFIILNGSLISGSIEDTYAWDVSRMTFSSQTSVEYPISNMNFTHNASGWHARVTEIAPSISPSTVTRKASGLVSANQRAVART